MTRARWIGVGVLVLLLGLLPFLPHGGSRSDGAIRPTARTPGQLPLTAGYGRVTPGFRREIDRVVASGTSLGRVSPNATPRALVDDLVRCATFEGQRYCLGTGWTDRTEAAVRASAARAVTTRLARPLARTGALSPLAALRQEARLSPSARAAAERAELERAARSVAKVWLLRHDIQGVPLPAHFLARHPEVAAASTGTATRAETPGFTAGTTYSGRQRAKTWRDYPRHAAVLDSHDVSEQVRTYWCGPASMQMIGWGWSGNRRSQKTWAHRLGTTTSGSSTAQMVHAVNRYTGFDNASYAGPYIVLDISGWSYHQWLTLMARHFVDYRAPVVLNPLLSTRFFPYLDHDGSGHFQVGRGYRKRPDGRGPLLGYFEPWNQQRFHPDEPFISRVQWRDAYKSYRAVQANYHQLGV